MSEFQVYKFRSVDRLLTRSEQKEISSWSSRTKASANGATFTYAYGDFPKKDKKVVIDYFDIALYFANWGTRRLMLKFPEDLVDFKALLQYDITVSLSVDNYIEVSRTKGGILVDFYWAMDEGGYWIEEEEFDTSDFIVVREAILSGDYSALYLYWLQLAQLKVNWADTEEHDEEYYRDHVDYRPEDYDEPEPRPSDPTPPIPAKLRYVGASLQPFLSFFEIDKDMVAAAKSASKEVALEAKKDYPTLLRQLSGEEKEDYLIQLLNGVPRLDVKLRRHLDQLAPKVAQPTQTIALKELKLAQAQKQQERVIAEREAAERAHQQKMEKMAKEETRHWQSVYFNLERKTGKSYDIATETLKDLKALAKFKGQVAVFNTKMRAIKKDYGRSRVLLERFLKAGL